MTKEREALKRALEALKYPLNQSHENFNVDMAELFAHRAITAIEEALMSGTDGAQPEYQSTADKSKLEKVPAKGALLAQPEQKQCDNCGEFGECCQAQPEQEPDYYGLTADHLWMSISKDHYDRLNPEYRMTCYTTPPQRKPLSDEEIILIVAECASSHQHTDIHFARAIEAALRSKNT